MDFKTTKAAIYRSYLGGLRGVDEIDFVDINSLIGIDFQKNSLLENTKNFLEDKLAFHTLLWGERGCGKSSLCKAVFCKFFDQNLRVIEFLKDDLINLVQILDEIRYQKSYKFIIYLDDLSFENGDDSYKYLKPLMEGSIEKVPSNVLLYVTSNRRHLVKENFSDNENIVVKNGEIHMMDGVNERLSLSDRFGLWLSFYQGSFKEYLDIVDEYFKNFNLDREKMHEEAKKFAMLRTSRSGRVARQFYEIYKSAL
ncbi:ATP-binding protein [Campylobacter sp. FMV-PI01]|uniref:ATP-binding protein n=1 Tax=Campylobacter portucalensis TaxID=2608384 RepID=A0A6L5WG08_9BACT|nr:ATP-binding protein [Campylobacter portucalensis]MSN96060.1 ATP-binding protein [Campylobacter portucalensis]